MNFAPDFEALLDANVLFPAAVRDILLHFADVNLFQPKWTNEINKEWIESLIHKSSHFTKAKLIRTRNQMNIAFPDANITQYESLISDLSLPDKNDLHILAAAIKGKVDAIVTFNIKDFPATIVKKFGIEVIHPDEFVENLILNNKSKAIKAFAVQVRKLKKPFKTEQEVLITLSKCGLPKSAAALKQILSTQK